MRSSLLRMTEEEEQAEEEKNETAECGSFPSAQTLRQARAQRPHMRIGVSWSSSSEGSGCSGPTRKRYPVLHRTARRLGGSPDARWQPPRRIGGCFCRGGVERGGAGAGEEGRDWLGGVCAVPADRAVLGQQLLLLLLLLPPLLMLLLMLLLLLLLLPLPLLPFNFPSCERVSVALCGAGNAQATSDVWLEWCHTNRGVGVWRWSSVQEELEVEKSSHMQAAV